MFVLENPSIHGNSFWISLATLSITPEPSPSFPCRFSYLVFFSLKYEFDFDLEKIFIFSCIRCQIFEFKDLIMTDLFYDTDLAYVHDTEYGNFARQAAKSIKKILNQEFHEKGLIIDLGCGNGIVAKELLDDGFKVLGIDKSEALIEIAKSHAPNGNYEVGSFFEIKLHKCMSVISTSECLNYATNGENEKSLKKLFKDVFAALQQDDGLFIFDMIEPGTAQGEKYIVEKDDWTMFLHTWEDQEKNILTRDVTLFRQVEDNLYRKSKEIHKARLYPHDQIVSLLEDSGFQISLFKQYDDLNLDEHHFGYKCKKVNI